MEQVVSADYKLLIVHLFSLRTTSWFHQDPASLKAVKNELV
jgi:hypothetical protein